MLFNCFMILLLACMCAGKTAIQGRIGKDLLTGTGTVLFFNGLYFIASTLCMLLQVILTSSNISSITVLYGSLFGLISVLFQFGSTSAMKYGPVSLSVLIINLGCALPILAGLVFWDETPTVWFYPGIVLMVAALFLSTDLKDLHIPHPARWIASVAVAFFANGALNILQKLHSFTPVCDERSGFVMVAYLVASLVAFSCAFLLKKERRTLRPLLHFDVLVKSAIVGVLLCSYQQLCLVMAHRMPSSVMYPMLSGMTLVACTLVGVVCFRDLLSGKQKLSVFCGIGAVIFLSL